MKGAAWARCVAHVGKTRNACSVLVAKCKRNIILKWVLEKWLVKVWNEFGYRRMEFSDRGGI